MALRQKMGNKVLKTEGIQTNVERKTKKLNRWAWPVCGGGGGEKGKKEDGLQDAKQRARVAKKEVGMGSRKFGKHRKR